MFKRPSQSSSKHPPEDTIHYLRSHFDNNVPNRSHVQKRLSIYNWNPGPRRGKEGAFEKQITGKWHVITLQEAIEYVDHELLTNRFHVTHHGGCDPVIEVKSIYLHDTRREFTCFFSQTTPQRPENIHSSVPTCYQYLRQRTVQCEKNSSSQFMP